MGITGFEMERHRAMLSASQNLALCAGEMKRIADGQDRLLDTFERISIRQEEIVAMLTEVTSYVAREIR